MLFEGTGTNPGDKTLEDKFFEYEVSREIISCALVVNLSSLHLYIHQLSLYSERQYGSKNLLLLKQKTCSK